MLVHSTMNGKAGITKDKSILHLKIRKLTDEREIGAKEKAKKIQELYFETTLMDYLSIIDVKILTLNHIAVVFTDKIMVIDV